MRTHGSSELYAKSEEKMMCPNMCYAINSNEAKYCYKCGYEFTDEDRYWAVKLIQRSASKANEVEK